MILTAHDLLDPDRVEELTDEPVTPIRRFQILALTAAMSTSDRRFAAALIDRTCIYTRRDDIALLDGSPCPLQDWHDLAEALRR